MKPYVTIYIIPQGHHLRRPTPEKPSDQDKVEEGQQTKNKSQESCDAAAGSAPIEVVGSLPVGQVEVSLLKLMELL